MKSPYCWFVAFVLFMFLLLHQADRLLIGPLTTSIMEDFQINEAQMGAVSSLAIVVASILYPVWGYLYDRYARSKLLALASFIWGATTWLNALAPAYPIFMLTRSITGIDDSSYLGLYSLLADYFGPRLRSRAYGVMQMSGPLGFMPGTGGAVLPVRQPDAEAPRALAPWAHICKVCPTPPPSRTRESSAIPAVGRLD